MREKRVAKRYAKALFSIAKELSKKEREKIFSDLEGLVKLIKENEKLERILKNPIIKVEDKKELLKKVLEKAKASKIFLNFCYLLADKKRLPILPFVYEYYRKFLDEEEGIIRGKLITAIDIKKNKKAEILKKLEEKIDKKLVLEFEKDKSIIGGLVLKIGDKVFDASIRAQLNSIKENIKRGEI